MKSAQRIGLFLCLLALTFNVSAQNVDDVRSITVEGQSSVLVEPDKLVFFLSLEQKGEVVSKLHAVVEQKTNAIVSFLLKQGLAEQDIQSMQTQLAPWHEHTPDGWRQKGLHLTRHIRVELRDISKYAAVLDGVAKIGIERLDGFSYQVENERGIYLQAIEQAIADANARASIMLKALGYKVRGVLRVNENSAFQPRQAMTALNRTIVGAETGTVSHIGSMPGRLAVDAKITVVFEIEPI